MYFLYESSTGLSLFKVGSDNTDLKLINTYNFANNEEALQHQDLIKTKTLDLLVQDLKKPKIKVSCSNVAKFIKKQYDISAKELDDPKEILELINKQFFNTNQQEIVQNQLSLSHKMSRYQLKINSESVDQLIVESVTLLLKSDEEINSFNAKLMEWVVWSFPEVVKAFQLTDFVRINSIIGGNKRNVSNIELERYFDDDQINFIKQIALTSCGTDISDEDTQRIKALSNQILELQKIQYQLKNYIETRMQCIAPNLSDLVGPMVAAKLLSRAKSLRNLAKAPASTIQILGAEMTLFNSQRDGEDNPKYGFLYQAELIQEVEKEMRGKVARQVACQAAIRIRQDVFGSKDEQDQNRQNAKKLIKLQQYKEKQLEKQLKETIPQKTQQVVQEQKEIDMFDVVFLEPSKKRQ
ncbi:Nucleolar_protein NOP5 [Hexamita inflata]|uniref:Nucleolar_protein NOP5 n=1 Tax=Hexamita inflata TaxID=28002 RepID=A0ABP1GRW4_9EUKA